MPPTTPRPVLGGIPDEFRRDSRPERLLAGIPPRSRVAHAVAVGALVVAGCAGSAGGDEGRYCTKVGDHAAALLAPALAGPDDVDDVLALYRDIASVAPLAVAPEWQAVTGALETASTVDPADPASVQRVADTARATQQAVDRVIVYTRDKCGVTLGQPLNTVPEVTLPPDTAGGG